MTVRARLLLLTAALATTGAACGDDDAPQLAESATTTTVAATPATVSPTTVAGEGDEGLPPNDEDELAAIFEPFFEPFGLTFTRGSVVNFGGGMHLALYVEPTGPSTDQEYLDRMAPSAAAIIPFLFAEFPRIASFDLCQEPVPTAETAADQAPPPRTIVLLTREQAATVDDWSTATLADIVRAARVGRGGHISADEAIEELPGYIEAQAEGQDAG